MNPQVLLVTIIGFILQNVQGQMSWMNMRNMNMRGMNPAMSLGLSGLQTLGAASTSGIQSGLGMNLGSATPASQMMMTCVGKQPASTGGQNIIAVTIKQVTVSNNNNNMFALFNPRPSSEIRADVSITSRDIDGMFSLVVTERARDESTCTTDGMGELVASASGSGNNFARQLGMFAMAPQFAAQLNSERSSGILRDVDIRPGEKKDLSISASSLPFSNMRNFAGHGVALCGVVTPVGDIVVNTNQFGFPIGNAQQMNTAAVCEGEIPLCCKLGYDNVEAMPF
ncbi:hypothetical protein LOTGIDRAFT_228102 [Lottia gigantea]|uniref:Superoxide dismutase copper/zinc binding domain-containing protein n=1 Tax=Lottia gigantea TaxID=225164 RepID=V4CSQ0_LOTGI|nr:hypothetical protein LOTGIDRAFT_228102 [Lottia gigantea]ESP05575.1 hypothetical protein LOTGIDRAFT_228102 [Lottia gigantea]